MNILVVHSGFAFSTLDVGRGLAKALGKLGHKIWEYETHKSLEFNQKAIEVYQVFNPKTVFSKDDFLEMVSADMVNYCIKYSIDLVLVVHGANIHSGKIENINRLGIKTAVFLTDEPQQVGVSTKYTPCYQYVFTNEKNTIENHGAEKTHYLPTAVDPSIFYPRRVPRNYLSDVFVGGSLFSERVNFLDGIGNYLKKWRVRIIGNSRFQFKNSFLESCWRRGSVNINEMAKFDAGTKIALDIPRNEMISEYGKTNPGIESTTVSPRVFEVPASGALLLTSAKREAIFELFEKDEVETYSEPLEAIEKIQYYMRNKKDREKKITKSRIRVMKDHTYEKRAQQITEIVGKKKVVVPMTYFGDSKKHINDLTKNTWCDLWANNFEENRKTILELKTKGEYTLDSYFQKSEDKIGILISSAPSIHEKIKDAKTMIEKDRDKFLIIGVNSGFKMMCENGIEPDFFQAVHPEENVTRHFEGIDTSKYTFISSSVTHPKTIEAWNGKLRFFHPKGLLNVHPNIVAENKLTIIGSALSVVYSGLCFLIGSGCKKIIMAGVDHAYSNGKKYFDQDISFDEIKDKGLLVAEDLFGKPVITDVLYNEMRNYIVELTEMADHHDIEFINASGHGILKGERIQIKEFKELIKEL